MKTIIQLHLSKYIWSNSTIHVQLCNLENNQYWDNYKIIEIKKNNKSIIVNIFLKIRMA